MTDDIRARLRSKSPYLKGSSAERVMDEAAAEIERLRAALHSLQGCDIDNHAQDIIRAALRPKP